MSTSPSPESLGSTPRALPKPPIRKAPPYPLAISSSSLSPHAHLSPNPSTSAANFAKGRNSLESSRSDLNSVRSDLTSLRCSEFPLPPLALPSIPASPQTPKSLYFSATPTTPRSLSPQPGSASQQQDPSKSPRSLKSLKLFSSTPRSHTPPTPRSLSPQSGFAHQQQQDPSKSPRSLKSLKLFSNTPRSQSPKSHFARQQQEHPPRRNASAAPGLSNDQQRDCELPQDRDQTRYWPYSMYKESHNGGGTSRPETPTTEGNMNPWDWPSNSGRSSPLQPPRPTYMGSCSPVRSHSPLRNDSFATLPVETQSVQSRNSVSPQPPRSPLPVPPRDSARYSHIARRAGVTDMGMDISEEQLLSTDFITEMLNPQSCEIPL